MRYFKYLLTFIAVTVCFVMGAAFSTNAASCKLNATVNASNVNVRSGAGTNYSVIKMVSKNTSVKLLNTSLFNKDWYKIKLQNGKKGYIHKDYLTINKNQIFIAKNKTVYAGYTGAYSLINTTGKTVKFTSDDTSIAKVNNNGKVTAIKEGTAKITAKANGKTSVSTLKVSTATVTLGDNSSTCYTDETMTISASCPKSVTYLSSDTSVATVDSKGVITPLKAGKATFTVSSKSDSKSFQVTFKKRTIALSVATTNLYKGCHTTIKASGGKDDYKFKSNNINVLTVTNDGLVTAVGTGTAKITCTSGSLTATKKFTVTAGTSVNISNTKATVNKDMTLYLKSKTSNVAWSSSNTDIATVDNGFVLGVGEGTAVITAYTSSGAVDCIVTVTAPQNVRFVYASENSAHKGDTITFNAITDMLRTNVKFVITDPNGKTSTLKNPSKVEDDGRYIWSATKTLDTSGEYKVVAYSKTAKTSFATNSSGAGTVFVNKTTDFSTVAFGERRASTSQINMIAGHEGFVGTVYADKLAGGVPTVGYGRVVYAGSTFYNGMSKKEAFAFLVSTVNESGYTSRVNKILTENNIKFSQQHFDALVDFSYNLGAYAITNDEDLLNVLLNSYGKASYKNKGFVSVTSTNVRANSKISAKVLGVLSAGTTVKLVSTDLYNENWYQVQYDSDTIGYIHKNNITLRSSNTTERNLNNVALNKFVKNYFAYHHASSTCYKGLLYRRVDEAETFFFGDYSQDGRNNKYSLSYTCSNNSSFVL